MLDLTGDNVTSYLLREIKDIVNRNPRFRRLGGDTTIQTSSMVAWGDVRVEVGRVSSQGTRLSTDYFMCTQHGRAILAKLENSEGNFIEWVQEIRDYTDTLGNQTPEAGVYYLNVDSVNEATREVGLTLQKYRWREGKSEFASGTIVYFSPLINPELVTPVDPDILFEIHGNTMSILTYSSVPLELISEGIPLVPNTDFWYQRNETRVIIESTVFGIQTANLPFSEYLEVKFFDQDGYELRKDVDFTFLSASQIKLSAWTAEGMTVYGVFYVKVDPTTAPVPADENNFSFGTLPLDDEQIASDQVTIFTNYGNSYGASDLVKDANGNYWLKSLLKTGEQVTWELRINAGLTTVTAHKLAVNRNIIDGLSIGIGDKVEVGDQCAILVSPYRTETYEVYGSKENITFNITVKANDRSTASEIAEDIRSHLLIRSRNEMESNGLTVFEITKDSDNSSRDASGTAPTTTYTLNISAAADWELYIPMVTRIGSFAVDIIEKASDFPGKPQAYARLASLGSTQFIPSYT